MSKPSFESWIRERLYHHTETVDEGSWELFSAALQRRKAKKILLRRSLYGLSAAAAVVAFFFLWSPRPTDPAGLPGLAQTDSLNKGVPSEIPLVSPTDIPEEMQIAQEITTARQIIQKAQTPQKDLVAVVTDTQKPIETPPDTVAKQPQPFKQQDPPQKQPDKAAQQQFESSRLAQAYPPYEGPSSRSRRRSVPSWSVALASTYSNAVDEMPFTTYAQHLSYSTRMSILASFNNNVTESQIENASLYFAPPISVGLNLQKGVNHWLSVGFGMNYTYLQNKSSIDNAGSDYVQKQQIHYVGIPLSVLFHFVNQPKLRVYASVGGAAEKAVWSYYTTSSRGISTTERERLAGIQWSVAAGLGLEYSLSPLFGLYLEPGIGHYFEYKQQPRSIRTAQPTQLKLELGLRFRI